MPARSIFAVRTRIRLIVSVSCLAFGVAATSAWGAPEVKPATRKPAAAPRPDESASSRTYRLAYRFHVDQNVHEKVTVDSEIKIQKQGVSESIANQSVTDRHYHIASIDSDGAATLDLTIDRVKLRWSFNNSPPVEYDTSGNVVPPRGFEDVKESIGKSGQIKIGTDGRIRSLTSRPETAADPSQNFLIVFPDKPVRIGDEWNDDIKVTVAVTRRLSQKITLRRKYVLDSVEGNIAKIRFVTAEVTPITDPSIRAQMVQLTPEGSIFFNIEKGIIVRREQQCRRVEADVMGPGSLIAANSNLTETLQ